MEFQWNLDEEFEKGQIIESEDETGYLPDFHYGKLCVRLNLANNAESWIMKHETSESSVTPIGFSKVVVGRRNMIKSVYGSIIRAFIHSYYIFASLMLRKLCVFMVTEQRKADYVL